MSDDHKGPDEVGSVAEEAAKLFGALSEWAKENGDGMADGVAGMAQGAAHAFKDASEHIATDAEECKFCPVCRTIHLVRDLSPEVKTHLAVASASLMQAAAALLATAVPDEQKASSARGDDIEPIDLDQDWPED
ncbi:hypothetical protein [Nocardioides sp. AE5]|uniref:hypothetical protein n=1 Tax=Nocardioides sp. AE5 TaxID=2962573 RepID=UPI002881E4ED|nr:hypothetical protein [Nocardioides sp. AE5]MDT0201209.1 hypothetical protein [Nocardioides sp. AE5]